jgi:CspA family cold shock protein
VVGTIRQLTTERGFGFIDGPEVAGYFFHKSAVRGLRFDQLRIGDVVTFDEQASDRGPRATNVARHER